MGFALASSCATGVIGGGGDGDGGDGGGGGDGGDGEACVAGTRLMYALDQYSELARFDPETKTFQSVGLLPCPVMFNNPYSMAIDGDGLAWVMYGDGQLFTLDLERLECTPTAWNSMGLVQFAMAFVDDDAGGATESLYFAGSGNPPLQPSLTLQRIDTATLTPTSLAPLQGPVELSAVGDELWGLYVNPDQSRLVQIDKTNGAALRSLPLPSFSGYPRNVAFTYWEGDFWVFLRISPEAATTVYQVDGTTGAIESATPSDGRATVGAGVSTCPNVD